MTHYNPILVKWY